VGRIVLACGVALWRGYVLVFFLMRTRGYEVTTGLVGAARCIGDGDPGRLRRRVRIDWAPGGRVLAGEFLVLGRIASGERMTRGLVREAWEVRRSGDLVWADALHVEGDLPAVLDHPAGFGGARAVACAVYAADDAPARQQEARRLLDDLPAGVRAGATVVNGVLVVRWLAAHGDDVRRAFALFWAGFRASAAGLAAALPRLWHV